MLRSPVSPRNSRSACGTPPPPRCLCSRRFDDRGKAPATNSESPWNDRQQQVRVERAARVNRVGSRPRAVARVVMLEEALRIIPAADFQNQPLAALHHDAGRPDLDLERNDLAGLQRLQLVVRVERPPGVARDSSSLRCEARSQPYATAIGLPPGIGPGNVTSRPSCPSLRTMAKTSASSLLDDTHRRSFTGPVISVSCSKAAVTNVACVCAAAGSAS